MGNSGRSTFGEETRISRPISPGVTTAWHALEGVDERYIMVEGIGQMEVGELPPTAVGPGDTVFIPAGTPQRITNLGDTDLVFYCVCSPRFTPDCYRDLDGALAARPDPPGG